MTGDDPFDLGRFVSAQQGVHDTALAELRAGRKRTHWMWFVLPQVAGLGRSATAQHYAVTGLPEARAYLAHPVLGPRLRDAAATVLDAPARSAEDLFGGIDAVKARSSMTLFARAADDSAPFRAVLDRWFAGDEDPETLRLLGLD
ncbi:MULTISPECIES: DUF1810 domain-containing protein [unclassified Curtobacterium]|uniref:DUF1810 domain-containing protein n=1 Tax=unclassified Curtobacterium TaxID=257496 RepID=UPI000DA7A9D0|nr:MULTISPECIES: DUF1810 domain-containing protein [unclassified Curtobacterium]PZE63132.1 DUF1810 domain-containing protein [Curtobacterium sp. MCBD17_021]WIB25592.1 DUF1810 domain-containing protein [Curtobacterium sp. MCSS17_015]